jgi:muramidase (phage lysozyme)
MKNFSLAFSGLFAITAVACGKVNQSQLDTLSQAGAKKLCRDTMPVTGSQELSAFLDVIAYVHGTNDQYNKMYNGTEFTSYADHPRQKVCTNANRCSDAAGRYMIPSAVWDELRVSLKLRDFSPESQDKALTEILYKKSFNLTAAGVSDKATFGGALGILNDLVMTDGMLIMGYKDLSPNRHSVTQLFKKYAEFMNLECSYDAPSSDKSSSDVSWYRPFGSIADPEVEYPITQMKPKAGSSLPVIVYSMPLKNLMGLDPSMTELEPLRLFQIHSYKLRGQPWQRVERVTTYPISIQKCILCGALEPKGLHLQATRRNPSTEEAAKRGSDQDALDLEVVFDQFQFARSVPTAGPAPVLEAILIQTPTRNDSLVMLREIRMSE